MTIEMNLDKTTKYAPESLVGRIVLLKGHTLWATVGKARRVVGLSGRQLITADVGGIVWRDGAFALDRDRLPREGHELRRIRDVAAVCDTVEEVLHLREIDDDFDRRFVAFKKEAEKALLATSGTSICHGATETRAK